MQFNSPFNNTAVSQHQIQTKQQLQQFINMKTNNTGGPTLPPKNSNFKSTSGSATAAAHPTAESTPQQPDIKRTHLIDLSKWISADGLDVVILPFLSAIVVQNT